MVSNISKRKLFEILFKGLPIGCFLVDKNLKIIAFNESAEELTGWKEKEALGRPCREVLKSSLCDKFCPLEESARLKRSFIARDATITSRFGEEIPICFSSSTVFDDEGHVEAGIEIFRDVGANKRLQTLRNRIISVFAHDIKTPIAVTGGLAKRLLDEKVGPLNEKQREYLKLILKESTGIENLVNELLELLHIESGRISKEQTTVNLSVFIKEIVDEIAPKAREKGIKIREDAETDLLPIYLDKIQIKRVLINLLDNAIKYSDPGKEIELSAHKKDGWLILEVKDQGIGIPEDDLPHVFEYFYRGKNSKKVADGTGIGLASSRAIVETNGGRIWVKSKEGQGTTFFIRLPFSPDP